MRATARAASHSMSRTGCWKRGRRFMGSFAEPWDKKVHFSHPLGRMLSQKGPVCRRGCISSALETCSSRARPMGRLAFESVRVCVRSGYQKKADATDWSRPLRECSVLSCYCATTVTSSKSKKLGTCKNPNFTSLLSPEATTSWQSCSYTNCGRFDWSRITTPPQLTWKRFGVPEERLESQ